MWLFDQSGFDNALRISHVIVGVMWMGLLWFFNFVQMPAYAEMDARGAQQRVRQAHVARAVVVPLGGGRHGRLRPADHRRWWPERHVRRRLLEVARAGVDAAARHPDRRLIDARQRVDGDLAEPADRHRQRAQRAGRRRSQSRTPPRPARGGAMASRQNTIFSLPLLVFMVGASHFYDARPLRIRARRREVRSSTSSSASRSRGARG